MDTLELSVEELAKAILEEDGDPDTVRAYAEDMLREKIQELTG